MTQSGPPGSAPPPPPPPSTPPPPPPSDWQSTPQQPSAAPPPGQQPAGSQMPAWTANITSQAPVAGPAGYYYADVPNRIIAIIVDSIILGIIGFVVGVILPPVVRANPNPTSFGDLVIFDPVGALISAVVGLIISAAYFVGTWIYMRGTPGMKLLGMQVGDENDGRTLTPQQGAIRWALLFGPQTLAQFLIGAPTIGILLALLAFIWAIVLLVTTAQSPTKQGLHDRYAKTMVVKAARAVA